MPTTANLVLFILDMIGYNNLIRFSKNVDILYKLLRLLEQIITHRNTKTNDQTTISSDQPLTVMWIAMLLPVNTTTSGIVLSDISHVIFMRISSVKPVP